MGLPVRLAELVGDQHLCRVVVRCAQQRLGQAHQDDALFRGRVVLLHEGVGQPAFVPAVAHGLDQGPRAADDPFLRDRIHACLGQQIFDRPGFIHVIQAVDPVAERVPFGGI